MRSPNLCGVLFAQRFVEALLVGGSEDLLAGLLQLAGDLGVDAAGAASVEAEAVRFGELVGAHEGDEIGGVLKWMVLNIRMQRRSAISNRKTSEDAAKNRNTLWTEWTEARKVLP